MNREKKQKVGMWLMGVSVFVLILWIFWPALFMFALTIDTVMYMQRNVLILVLLNWAFLLGLVLYCKK